MRLKPKFFRLEKSKRFVQKLKTLISGGLVMFFVQILKTNNFNWRLRRFLNISVTIYVLYKCFLSMIHFAIITHFYKSASVRICLTFHIYQIYFPKYFHSSSGLNHFSLFISQCVCSFNLFWTFSCFSWYTPKMLFTQNVFTFRSVAI